MITFPGRSRAKAPGVHAEEDASDRRNFGHPSRGLDRGDNIRFGDKWLGYLIPSVFSLLAPREILRRFLQ